MNKLTTLDGFVFESVVNESKLQLQGLTMVELLDKIKVGDKIIPDGDAYGMRHDKFKTAKLVDSEYTVDNIMKEYNPNTGYIRISNTQGIPFSIIFKNKDNTGFKIKK